MTASDSSLPIAVDIGIFAHDEAEGIGAMLRGLAAQDILTGDVFDARVLVLANGCSDETAAIARTTVDALGMADRIAVVDLPEGGKSRTWNRFVHDLSRPVAALLAFVDADIMIPDPTALRRLVALVHERPELKGAPSRAVKDIVHAPPAQLSLMDRLIVAGASSGSSAWRHAICGQLYVLRSATARSFHMPIGLPVEDGFVRAMVVTDRFTHGDTPSMLDGREDIFHVYDSERALFPLIRHQTRLVIGSAVNVVLFARLAPDPGDGVSELLRHAAADPDWLKDLLAERLPTWRYGYVPWIYLTMRFVFWREAGRRRWHPRTLLSTALGLGFDAVVYVLAQIRMARGAGAGHW